MTSQRDLSNLLGAFLAEGSESVATRVVDDALLLIDHTPQRRAVRLPWRPMAMNNGLRFAIGGVALVVVLVGGTIFLGGRSSNDGGPMETMTPSPAVTPTIKPSSPAASDSTDLERAPGIQPGTVTDPWQACATEGMDSGAVSVEGKGYGATFTYTGPGSPPRVGDARHLCSWTRWEPTYGGPDGRPR
jgi:hypothetical protein